MPAPLSPTQRAALPALLAAHAPATPLPFVPAVSVHQAPALVPLWSAVDALLGAGPSGSAAPFWAIPWVGGQALSRYLLENPTLLTGAQVLDFAAGSGAAGLAALRAGAASVLATELDPVAVAVMHHNAALNGLGGAAFEPSGADVVGQAGPWSVVLAGDVCYERGPAGAIFTWLRRLAASRTVLLADPGRAFLPTDGLAALARYRVPTHADVDGEPWRDTTVYRVLPS